MKCYLAFTCSGNVNGLTMTRIEGTVCQYNMTASEAGSYQVTCIVNDTRGNTNSDTVTVEVQMSKYFIKL